MIEACELQYNEQNEDRLAKWLVVELAATIMGSKPSTILSIVDTKHCPLLKLWRKYGPSILAGSPVRYFILKTTPSRLAILFYRQEMLEQCVQQPNHNNFLRSHGYPVDSGLQACLEHLRCKFSFTCPHEFGVLLGIPLKDVLGFMGLSDLPLCCRADWHIYGQPDCSLAVIKRFNDDRRRVVGWLDGGRQPDFVLSSWQDVANCSA